MGGIGSKQDPNSAPESSSKGSAEDFSERESVPKKKFETNWESFQLHNGDLLRDVDSEELNQLKSNTDPFSLEPRLGNEVLREIYPKGKKLLEEKLVESYNIQKVEGEKDVVDAFRMQIVERVYEVPEIVVYERLIPKVVRQYQERTVEIPYHTFNESFEDVDEVHVIEKVMEVPIVQVEEKIVKIPKISIKEKLVEIEGPVQYQKKISTVDMVEYREVPVEVVKPIYEEVYEEEEEIVEVEEIVEEPKYIEHAVEDHTYRYEEVEKIVEIPVWEYKVVPKYVEVPFFIKKEIPVKKTIDKTYEVPVGRPQ
eukprot:Filipodium_phascolosomae@DN1320_c0_g1_i2.p1